MRRCAFVRLRVSERLRVPTRVALSCAAMAMSSVALSAQRAPIAPAVRSFVAVDTAVVALTNVRVIDGTGAAPMEGQTLIVRDGRIAALGRTGTVDVPAGALVMDLTGKSVIPGLVMVGLDMLVPQLREQYEQRYAATSKQTQSVYAKLFPVGMAMERAFARAGGTLVVGTDPTGGGGLVPGFSNQRAIELLVEAGFTPLEAIRMGTLNGATYLGRNTVGSIATGKQADVLVINGNPAAHISDVRNVQLVFKQGVGYDPAALMQSVKGKAGLY